MRFSSGTYAHVVLLCANPADIRHRKEQYATARLKNKARCIRAVFPISAVAVVCRASCHENLIAHSLNGRMKALGGKWLEQVIDRMNFKRPQCVVVISRCKDDFWHDNVAVAGQLGNQIKAVHAGHPDIKEQELRSGYPH